MPVPVAPPSTSPSVFAYKTGLTGNSVNVNMTKVCKNIQAIKNHQTPPSNAADLHQQQSPIFMAVVKDNGYSTDCLKLVYNLLENENSGVDGFMVAHFSEARVLRNCKDLNQEKLKKKRLLAIYAEPEDYEDVVKMEVETTVDNSERIELLGDAAKKVGKPAKVHLHINTGMNRLGVVPDEAFDIAKQIAKGVQEGKFIFTGLKTHLSTADETTHDFCWQQEAAFHKIVEKILNCEEIKKANAIPELIHSQNTAWSLRYQPWNPEHDPQLEKFGVKNASSNAKLFPRRMLRIGIGMYGYCSLEVELTKKLLQSAVTIRSKIASVHAPPPGAPISYARKFYAPTKEEMQERNEKDDPNHIKTSTHHHREFRIATIPQGYGEGITKWPDHFVCIRGKQCPIVGKITMDFIMADVTELGDEVKAGDSVLILGKEEEVEENRGSEVEIHVASDGNGTSPHQFLARGGYRLQRNFYYEEELRQANQK